MSNPYFDHTSAPAQGAPLSSAVIRAELDLIEQGFDKLPTLAGNGLKKVRVNAAGTGLEAVADTVTAANVSNTPAGNIAATDVQSAINELDSEKASTGHTHAGVYQPASANLDEFAAVNPTAAGLALLDDTDAAAQRATLGLAIGSDVQAYDAATAKTNVPQSYTKPQRPHYLATDTVSATGTYTYDGDTKGQINLITLTNAIAVTFGAPSNIVEGSMYKFILKAGDTSARTFAYNAAFKFPSGTAPITAGSATTGGYDTLTFIGGASNTLIYDGHTKDAR